MKYKNIAVSTETHKRISMVAAWEEKTILELMENISLILAENIMPVKEVDNENGNRTSKTGV